MEIPQWYFVYFYEDLVNDPLNVIKDILVYIGVYPELLDEKDVENIAVKISFEETLKDGVFMMQRNGKVCDYDNQQNQLFDETVTLMHQDMVDNLRSDLLQKFNLACPI